MGGCRPIINDLVPERSAEDDINKTDVVKAIMLHCRADEESPKTGKNKIYFNKTELLGKIAV